MAKSVRLAGIRVDLALGQAQFNKGMDEATRRIVGLQNTVKGVSSGINTAFKAIALGYVVKQIASLGSALGELAEKGEIAGSIADGFEALGGSASSIDDAKKATIGLLDQFELMKIASKGLSANVVGFNDNFGKIADLGARVANTLGTDTGAEVEKLTQLIVKGSSKLSAYGFSLEGIKGKAEKQKAVMEQLPGVMARYAEVTDSAANAQTAFGKKLEEGWKIIGIAINSNESLTQSWRDMELALNALDWKQVGQDIAEVAAALGNMGSIVLPKVVGLFTDLSNIIQYQFGQGSIETIARLNDQIVSLQNSLKDPLNLGSRKSIRDEIADLESQKKVVEDYARLEKQREKDRADASEQDARERIIKQYDFKRKLDEESAARTGKAEADKIEKLKESWAKIVNGQEQNSLKEQLGKAIETLDQGVFESLKEKLRFSVEQGFIDGQKDAIAANVVSMEDVAKQAKIEGEIAVSEITDTFLEKQKAASQESIQMWQGLFQNAITGVTFNLKDALEQVATGFAAKLAQATLGDLGLGKIGSASDLGSALFEKLGLGDVFGGQAASAYYGPGGAPSALGGAASGGLAASMTALVPVAAAAAGAYLMQHDVKNILSGKKDTSAFGTAARVSGAITSFGFTEVARASGFFGKQRNGEDAAIHAVAGSLETLVKKFNSISTLDSSGRFTAKGTNGFDIQEGKVKGNWASEMDSWGAKAKSVFLGLGEGLKAINGITEDVAGQIGFLLGDVLGGSIDSARLNVKKLGLDFESIETALVDVGKSGKQSWKQVEDAIQGASEAFKPGLVALADTKGALNEIVSSAGRGEEALKGVRDAGVEGMEAKLKTLEQLKQRMIAEGGDPEYVNALISSALAAGLKTVEELAKVPDRVGGQIVAGMEARSPKLAAEWGKMGAEIEKFGASVDTYSAKLDGLNNKKIDVKFNVSSELDDNTKSLLESGGIDRTEIAPPDIQAFAKGDVVSGRSMFRHAGGLGMMGEAGPEAILPLKRVNGILGVTTSGGSGKGAGGITLIVNAQGAEVGVEERIMAALSSVTEAAVEGAVEVIMQSGY